uniref:Dynamin family protein n=1 Tax=Cyanothece sp. (strain PCC 7425 / ATCC 29141) TaxID=395961 RepID=B8HYS8_CYAP4
MKHKASNFGFLQPHNQELAEIGEAAERMYALKQPQASISVIRTFAERLARLVACQESIDDESIDQKERLDKIGKKFKRTLDESIIDKFDKLRRLGNSATHEWRGNLRDAGASLRDAYEISVWYYKKYISYNPPASYEFELPEVLPELDKEEIQTQAEQLNAAKQNLLQLEKQLQQAQVSLDTNSGLIESLQQELNHAKLRALQAEQQFQEMGKRLIYGGDTKFLSGLMTEIIADALIEQTCLPPSNWSETHEHTASLLSIAEESLQVISTLIGERSQKVLTLSSGENIFPGLGMVNDAVDLLKRATDLHEGIFNLIVIGEFKHGKSTLLNAMLGGKILPANTLPTTAIITMLVRGETDKVEIFEAEPKQSKIISIDEFRKSYSLSSSDQETIEQRGFIDRFENIEYAKIECKHPLCSGGVRLIDSPGLAEQLSRTRIATNFFKQSQAALFILNACQPLGENERDFIETYFKPGFVDHVFFVVNRMDAIDDEDEVEEVKNYFRNYLKNYFLDSDGKPDLKRLDRHLFFTNARAALNARLKEPVNNQALEASGVLELEKALERFLSSPDKVRSALSSTFKRLINIVYDAHARIEHEKAALEQSIADLELRRAESEVRLQSLEAKQEEIRETIRVYSEVIAAKLCSNLAGYLSEQKDLWKTKAPHFITTSLFNPLEIATSFVSSSKKENIKRTLERDTQDYLQNIFKDWSNSAAFVADEELKKLSLRLETEITEFSRELVSVENFFSGGVNEGPSVIEDLARNREEKILQLVLCLAMGDFSHMSSALLGRGDWLSFVQGAIFQAAIGTFVLSVFQGGPLGWALFIVLEIGQFIFNMNRHEDEIIRSIGDKIHQELRNRLPQMQESITWRTKEQFWNLAHHLTESLQGQIDEVRQEQQRIIEQKKTENFSVDTEKKRMDLIGQELVLMFNRICEATYSKTYSLDQIKWLSRGEKLI